MLVLCLVRQGIPNRTCTPVRIVLIVLTYLHHRRCYYLRAPLRLSINPPLKALHQALRKFLNQNSRSERVTNLNQPSLMNLRLGQELRHIQISKKLHLMGTMARR